MPISYRNKAYFTAGAGIDETFIADANLSTCQYRFVTVASTAGYVTGANGASNPTPIGVLQNAPALGEIARVRVFGTTCVVAVTRCGRRARRVVVVQLRGRSHHEEHEEHQQRVVTR